MSKVKRLVHRQRIALAAIVFLLAVGTMALGAYRFASWTSPLADGNYSQALHSEMGNRSIALYDRGLAEYQQALEATDETVAEAAWEAAQSDLNAAYDALLQAGNGAVPGSSRQLAADIQFRLGNMQVINGLNQQSLELIQAGVQNYEECLRLDPDNMFAKYNIELLEQSNEVNGQNNPGGPGEPGDQPGEPGDKPGTGQQAGHTHGDGT